MKFQLLSFILLLTSFTIAFTIPSHDLQHDVVLAPRAITPGTNTTIPDRKGGGGGHGGGGGESGGGSSGGGDSSSGGDDSSSSSGSTSSGAHTGGSGTSAGNALGVEKVYILMVAGLVGMGVEVLGSV
jgi:hypothetical protein